MRLIFAILATLLLVPPLPAPERTVDDFFNTFTDEWMRLHTDFAASTRYFTGAEQDAFERQIEPRTLQHRDSVRRLVRKGLNEIHSFDRSKMTDSQRLSAISSRGISTIAYKASHFRTTRSHWCKITARRLAYRSC